MVKKLVQVILLLLTIFIGGYAIFLLVRGAAWSSVPVVEPNVPLPPAQIVFESPYWPALYPILGSLLVLGGLLTRKLTVAWLGVGLLITSSFLYVFSMGGIFLKPSLLLVVLLLIYHISSRRQISLG